MTSPIDAHLLRTLFPHASKSTLAANAETDNPRPAAVVEHHPSDGALAASKGQAQAPSRVHLRFESVRSRLLDPDNISIKWTVDALRYAGFIRGDEPDKITIETTQRKAAKGEAEHTLIEITYP